LHRDLSTTAAFDRNDPRPLNGSGGIVAANSIDNVTTRRAVNVDSVSRPIPFRTVAGDVGGKIHNNIVGGGGSPLIIDKVLERRRARGGEHRYDQPMASTGC
jgi:hypothetical protein